MLSLTITWNLFFNYCMWFLSNKVIQTKTITLCCIHTHQWLHTATQTWTCVSGCRPLSLFTADPAGHNSCVTGLIPPESSRKSRRSDSCLVWESAFVRARVCPTCPYVSTQSWFKWIKHTSLWPHTGAYIGCRTLGNCCWMLNKLGSKINFV